MIVIDGHLHLAWEMLRWNRDVTKSVVATRQAEAGMSEKGRGRGTVGLPEMRRGEVAVCFGLICISTDPEGGSPGRYGSYRTPEATWAAAQAELACYRVLEKQGLVRMIGNSAELEAHINEWKVPGDTQPPLGIVLALEGCDPILSPEQVDEWWKDGLRIATISHYGMGRYAAGTGPSGGVTSIGRELLKNMERLNIILDTAHLSEEAFWEAVDLFHGPIAFTHGGVRALVPMWRTLSDAQLRVLIERGGVIGTSMDNWQITEGWIRQQSTPDLVSLENVVDHIDHICQLAGNADHAAIGTDLGGGFGTEQCPGDLDSIADLQKIAPILRQRGYSEEDVGKIMHGNWIRLLEEAWS